MNDFRTACRVRSVDATPLPLKVPGAIAPEFSFPGGFITEGTVYLVERELLVRLRRGNASGLVRWACRLSPRLIWKLPFSRARPPEGYHRRIVAVLLPHKLRLVERQLAVYAFHEGLQ